MEPTMKLKIPSLSAVVIFALTLCFSVDTTSASPKSPAAAAVPLAAPEPAAAPLPEPHPEIREAIASLRRAKDRLEHAEHDFDGHRVQAIRAIEESLHELQD